VAARGAESANEATEEETALAEPFRDIAAQYPDGQWMDHVFGCGQSIKTTYGPMTSCIAERMTEKLFGRCT